jgi:hypothetical protein
MNAIDDAIDDAYSAPGNDDGLWGIWRGFSSGNNNNTLCLAVVITVIKSIIAHLLTLLVKPTNMSWGQNDQ